VTVVATAVRYLLAATLLNLLWEVAQLPLYTIWSEGTRTEQLWAVLHCTGGDAVIATSTLGLSILFLARKEWPGHRYALTAGASIILALVYTVFSEKLNIARGGWEYSPAMPRTPVLGTGLAPLVQWIVVPLASFWLARKRRAEG